MKLSIIKKDKIFCASDLQNIAKELLPMNTLQSKYLRSEQLYEEERLLKEAEKRRELEEVQRIVDCLFEMNKDNEYYSYTIEIENLKVKFGRLKCPENLQATYDSIKLAESDWKKISVESVSQSDCYQWHAARAMRITSSKRAHQVKTRKEDFEKLARQFCKQKFDGRMLPAMVYGLKMEPEARKAFTKLTGLYVDCVGLVVKFDQPFLAASSDGFIFQDMSLLEIKCPFSCKNCIIVDRKGKVCYVKYLYFQGETLELKKSHCYYTQINIAMYVLNVKKCHFFVYSKKDSVHLVIDRDEEFLSGLIPKIEEFYFKHMLQLLK